ncbi:MarR family winged helix-turn-helix transcriptional regulator [Arthrobacter agilis]|uniref:MarR family winged helix-turn-helix transcriptional regulator n=1 Tax=Arthrobacter agilis TaxID=37921 RepID=UPI002782CBCF|nr:MarR family winged helix-turn-helix transcriptional regulator [Arthrobacter agilis]MDQ0735917.1 DNA-binding MarR family transcriptional regulator [Arthrobacter agilis]
MEGRRTRATGTARHAALDVVEERAAAMCRSEQRVCRILARRIDPAMEPAAYSVLTAARMLGPCRVTDLATTLGMGTPGVSGHVAALQRLGLVERGPTGGDERSHPVVLTQEGARRIDEARLGRRQAFRRQLDGWAAADVVELVGLLARFNAAYLAAEVPEVPRETGETGLPRPAHA